MHDDDRTGRTHGPLLPRNTAPLALNGGAGLAGTVAGGVAGGGLGAAAGAVLGPPGAAIGFLVGFTAGAVGGATGGVMAARKLEKMIENEEVEP